MRSGIGRQVAHHRRTKRRLTISTWCYRIRIGARRGSRLFHRLRAGATRGDPVEFLRGRFGTRASQLQILSQGRSEKASQRISQAVCEPENRSVSACSFGAKGNCVLDIDRETNIRMSNGRPPPTDGKPSGSSAVARSRCYCQRHSLPPLARLSDQTKADGHGRPPLRGPFPRFSPGPLDPELFRGKTKKRCTKNLAHFFYGVTQDTVDAATESASPVVE